MGKRLKYSRWRRLPGVYRVGEHKATDPSSEPQRLTLYVPARYLDRAEALARKVGAGSVQEFCEQLLISAIESEAGALRLIETEERRGPLEGLDAIANDPEYLAEWSSSAREPDEQNSNPRNQSNVPSPPALPQPIGPDEIANAVDINAGSSAAILRHAAIPDETPGSFLTALRKGEAVGAEACSELLAALVDLEHSLAGAAEIDRRVAYALHRLAFEGQVLITDAWPMLAADQATLDVLRLVQEAVDRVLSGEDIRYYGRPAAASEEATP